MTFDIPGALYRAVIYGRERGVLFRPMSSNRKLAPLVVVKNERGRVVKLDPVPERSVSSTYVAIDQTCPSSCAWKGAGCYVTASKFTAGANARLEAGATEHKLSGADVIRLEAALLSHVTLKGYLPARPLRLHVGGDVVDADSTAELGDAGGRWLLAFGEPVWTYTHRWREIPADAWGSVRALASVETAEDAEHALDLGYAPALVVVEHTRAKAQKRGSMRVVPCPAETHDERTCFDCRLCTDDLHARRTAIAFAAHGASKKRVRVRLTQLPLALES